VVERQLPKLNVVGSIPIARSNPKRRVAMTELRFRAGEVIFREGDESTGVAQITSGEVEVVRMLGGTSIVLGRAGRGEFVGEMGVIERRPRSATVRALTEVTLHMLPRELFIERIAADRNLALSALLRLSERLHAMDDRVAGQAAPASGEAEQPAQHELPVTLYAASELLAGLVPPEGIRISSFPFHVGRRPGGQEPPPAATVALQIEDHRPYRLSRLHFSVVRADEGFAVSDLTSTLGTEVNGEFLGETFAKARAALREGENRVVAGGVDSPFVFRIVVG
jgi:CRP/FNR family cyclic AMP-dependent transcriptional regulator